jgi:hypothetical protein
MKLEDDEELKEIDCAFCGLPIQKEVYRYMDNFLQLKYFEEPDGSDNMFCSMECAGNSLMLECFELPETIKKLNEIRKEQREC